VSVIISDSTTIITLLNIQRMDVLSNLFAHVNIPQQVYDEIVMDEKIALDSDFFITQKIKNNELYALLSKSLDAGESAAIVLAKEMDLSLIIDEKKGRKIASNLGINIFGFLGLLVLNYKKSCLTQEEIMAIYNQAKAQGFRISKRLEEEFLGLIMG